MAVDLDGGVLDVEIGLGLFGRSEIGEVDGEGLGGAANLDRDAIAMGTAEKSEGGWGEKDITGLESGGGCGGLRADMSDAKCAVVDSK